MPHVAKEPVLTSVNELVDAKPPTEYDHKARDFLRELVWGAQGLFWIQYDGLRVGARDHGLMPVELFNKNEFWFNHIGDAFETTLLMWGTRGMVEVFDTVRSSMGSEKISPRLKMWLSVLVGMAIPITIESLGLPIGGNTAGPDVADSFGPLVAGILAGSTWELTSFLGDMEKMVNIQTRLASAKDRITSHIEKASQSIADMGPNIQARILRSMDDIDLTIDAFTMEMRVASLMLDDLIKNQNSRIDALLGNKVEKNDVATSLVNESRVSDTLSPSTNNES